MKKVKHLLCAVHVHLPYMKKVKHLLCAVDVMVQYAHIPWLMSFVGGPWWSKAHLYWM